MKQNDVGDFTVLYVEPGDQRADLFQTAAVQKKPMVIILASQAGVLQKPDDFTLLKYVKRQADLPIIFILPLGTQQAQLAARNGFPVYQSMDALLDTLSIGQIAHARTTNSASPSRSLDSSRTVNAPYTRKGTRPISTKDLGPTEPTLQAPDPTLQVPDEDSQGEVQRSHRISQLLTPIPPSLMPEEDAEQQEIDIDPSRTPPPHAKDHEQHATATSWSGTDIYITDRNTAPLAPGKVGGAGWGQALASQTLSVPRASARGLGDTGLTPSLPPFNENAATKWSSPLPPSIIELPEPNEEEEQAQDQPLYSLPTQKLPVGVPQHPRTDRKDKENMMPPPASSDADNFHPRLPNHSNGSALRRRWQAYPRLSILLCLLVIVATGSFLLLPRFVNGAAVVPQINGHLVFTSSGQVSETSNQGIEDQVTLDLTNLSVPTNGKALYAWLLGDKRANDPQTILLGKLQLNNGTTHLFYPGDAQHTSMLLTMSRMLITEEDAAFTPIAPSPNQTTWRYYSEFSSTPINAPDNAKHFSFLDHLRHLLAADPTLDELELPGGLNKWLYNNTNKVKEWVDSTRQQWEETKDINFVHRQVQRSLQFLDGNTFVYQDIPQGTSLLVNERLARVGLINVTGPHQEPPNYLDHVSHHLNGLLEAKPTPAVRQKITALITALGNVNQWLKQVRYDAQQLMNMTDSQMEQQSTLSVINDMIANMDKAYSGQPDPSTNTMREGVNWLHNQMQFLATMDIAPWDGTVGFGLVPNHPAQAPRTLQA